MEVYNILRLLYTLQKRFPKTGNMHNFPIAMASPGRSIFGMVLVIPIFTAIFGLFYFIPLFIAYLLGKFEKDGGFFKTLKSDPIATKFAIAGLVLSIVNALGFVLTGGRLFGLFGLFYMVYCIVLSWKLRKSERQEKDKLLDQINSLRDQVNNLMSNDNRSYQQENYNANSIGYEQPVNVSSQANTESTLTSPEPGERVENQEQSIIPAGNGLRNEMIADAIQKAELSQNISRKRFEKGPFNYKCVPGPVVMRVGAKEDPSEAVRGYGAIIQQEAVGGWEFFLMQEIPIVREPGCLGKLMKKKEEYTVFNMLVFRKKK